MPRDEYKTLPEETQRAVDAVIEEARAVKGLVRRDHGHGDEVYAYIHPSGDGISWGHNSSRGWNTARGIKP